MPLSSAVLDKPVYQGALTRLMRQLQDKVQSHFAWNRAYNETYKELKLLSDRDLADLGMVRGQLAQIAKDAADGKVG